MSATLYFSNSPSVLLERLSADLRWEDPFDSPRIATPSSAMKRWVQLRLAEARGIVANVEFLHLERILWSRLEELDQDRIVSFRKPAQLLDERHLQLLILALLRHDPPAELREYLEEDAALRTGGEAVPGGPTDSRRLAQLSLKLAGYFREYEYSRVQEYVQKDRPGLAHLWKHGKDCFSAYLGKGVPKSKRAEVERLERWQKSVYHALFRPGGLRDRLGERLGQWQYTLPQYAELVLSQDRPPAQPGSEAPAYHLFGLSQISPFHRSLIQRLADIEVLRGHHARFSIYSLNPCAEYWEDALSSADRRRMQQEDLLRRRKYVEWRQLDTAEKQRLRREIEEIQREELKLEAEENPLLGQWGRPGRENIQLWCQVTQYDFHEHFREPAAGGLLGALQGAVLARRGRLETDERTAQDRTLRVFACPEIHREVETVRQAVIEDLLEDPALRPEDIAIMVPDLEKYRPVLAAIFGRTAEGEPGHVPFVLEGSSVPDESDYARGVASLFELARGRFSRREVLALAGNPCFRRGIGIDEEEVKSWGRWAEKLNIFHSFDGEDKARRGYPPDGVHTWREGLDRLLLGTVMESPEPGDGRHFAGLAPFADGDSPDRELLEGFLLAVEDLHRRLAPLRDGVPRTWGGWLEAMTGLFDACLAVPEDEPLESLVRGELRRYLLELERMDVLEDMLAEPAAPLEPSAPEAAAQTARRLDSGGVPRPRGIPADLVMDLLLERLAGLRAGRQAPLSGGVNISSLHSLRSLPFKSVYVLGLGEGEFPEDAATSTLDLRQSRRVIGDVDPAARNRYLFLETLVCAQGRLGLSWVCRDVQQGKSLPMSSVLGELIDFLEDGILPAAADGSRGRFRPVQVPLLSRTPSLFPAFVPAAGIGAPWDPPPNHDRDERILAWLEAGKARMVARGADRQALGGVLQEALQERLTPGLRRVVFPPDPAEAVGARGDAEDQGGKPIRIHLEDLRLYLENPLEYTLRRRLGIRDRYEEDPAALEDEPFFCPPPWDREILERTIAARLDPAAAREDDPHAAGRRAFESLYDGLAMRGLMPAGHYRTFDREALVEKAERALTAVDDVLKRLAEKGDFESLGPVTLGDGDRRPAPGRAQPFPPIALTVAGRAVELHGRLPWLFRYSPGSGEGCAALIFSTGEFKARRLLQPFLFHAAGLLSPAPLGDWLRAGRFTVHHVHPLKGVFQPGLWPPFQPEAFPPAVARRYLESLISSLLAGPDFDVLPFDAIATTLVEKIGTRPGEGRLMDVQDPAEYAEALREELEETENDRFAAWKPGPTARLLDGRVPDDAWRKIHARLEPFFNWRA